jgi:hypothetical protein
MRSSVVVACGALLAIASCKVTQALAVSPPSATVDPGRRQTFTAHGGTGPFTWTFATNASGASLQGGQDYAVMRPAPAVDGAAQLHHWGGGQPVVVRDNHGNHDLFTFGSPGAPSGALSLLRSGDQGESWSWVPSALVVDSAVNAGLISVAQDSAGTVHLLFFRAGFLDVAYYRLALSYSAGAIDGYTALAGPIVIPGTYAGDRRGTIRVVTTASGAEVLAVLVAASDPGGTRLQGSMCITSTLAPSSADDFKSLGGAAGAVTMVADDARGVGGSHDHTLLFAQLGASRDLWMFGGNIVAEAGPTPSTTINRVRLAASGSTWTPGPLVDGSTPDTWLMGIAGTTHFVWVMYGRYADGQIRFARVNPSGGYEEPVASIPSPVNDGLVNQTMAGVFSVHPDEQHIAAIFARDPSPFGQWFDFTPRGATWDGSSWRLRIDVSQGDPNAVAFADGLGGSVGWDDGVVAVLTKTDGTSFDGAIHLATMKSSLGTAAGAAIAYTAGATHPATDVVTVTDAEGKTASATITVP